MTRVISSIWTSPEFHEQFDPERIVLTLDYNDKEDETGKTNNGIENQSNGIENLTNGIENLTNGIESGEKNAQSGEKNAQSGEKTAESSEKTAEGSEKTAESSEKTTEGSEKNAGSGEKMDSTPQKTVSAPQKTDSSPQKTSQKIVSFMSENPKITRHELALFLSISDDAVKQQIAKLVEKQIIRRVGPDKGGHWEVLDKNDESI